jgi:hypothetical protein
LQGYIDVAEMRKFYSIHYAAMDKLKKEMEGVVAIGPIEHLCDQVCNVMDEDHYYYYYYYYYSDSTHMRPWYAKESLNYLNPIFDKYCYFYH